MIEEDAMKKAMILSIPNLYVNEVLRVQLLNDFQRNTCMISFSVCL